MNAPIISLGIDIGGTNTAYGLVNAQGAVIYKHQIATNFGNNYEQLITTIKNDLNNRNLHFDLVGVGAPNIDSKSGFINHAANLPWSGIIPIRQYTEEVFKLPVALVNDAKATAYGEFLFGKGKGCRDFIVVTLGTGLGTGIFVNGQMLMGHHCLSGELGHTIVVENGRKCGCGRNGCLETYVSAKGMVATLKEMLINNTNSDVLNIPEHFSAKDIYIAAENEDVLAEKTFQFTGNILGLALANTCALLDPEKIILFGGLAHAGKFLLNPTISSFEHNLLHIYKNRIKIECSALPESDAAILGAAAVALHENGLI